MTSDAHNDDEKTVARRWEELKAIQDALLKVWQSYMLWAIWFITATYSVIAYVAGFDKDSAKLDKCFAVAAASASIFLDVVAIVITIMLCRYTYAAIKRGNSLSVSPGFHEGVSAQTMMAGPLLKVLPWGFLLSYFIYIVLWAVYFSRTGQACF